MKRIWFLLLFVLWFISPVLAQYWMNLEDFLNVYVTVVSKNVNIPEPYHYIDIKYKNIDSDSKIYENLQKAIYLNLFPNAKTDLPINQKLTKKQVLNIVSLGFDVEAYFYWNEIASKDWLFDVLSQVKDLQTPKQIPEIKLKDDITNNPLFIGVYNILKTQYLWETNLKFEELLHGTIKWLVEALNDPYTAFFAPTEAQSFTDDLQWEFYGIGAYVEMNKPWELIIVSPIKWSPAEKIGLMGWDRILQINNQVVDAKMSITQATVLIKWPTWTTVRLKVLRDGKVLDFAIVRQKIVIENIDYQMVVNWDSNVCVVSIVEFDFDTAKGFTDLMQKLSVKNCKKFVFDLRNNPWWSLDEVVQILNHFVPSGEIIATIKSNFITEHIVAWDDIYPKILSIPLRILINEWSASASEIFALVLKDYVADILLVWQKTFGKWSVQELVNYIDGSMLKYTMAKRYSWKSQTNIDWIGILPDKIISNIPNDSEDLVLKRAIEN